MTTPRRLVTRCFADLTPPPETPALCPACRSGLLVKVGDDAKRCDDCGAVYMLNRGSGAYERMAKVFGGGCPGKPRPRPKRWPHRLGSR